MRIGYARVSTLDQNLDLQIDALKAGGCERIYQEKASGGKADRPELLKMVEHARTGDAIVIWKLDRLGRGTVDLISLVNDLQAKGVGLISLNDPIDTTTAQGRLVFSIFASLAEYERSIIKERTLAGLAATKRRGTVLGRPKGLTKKADEKSRIVESLYRGGKLSVQQICEQLSISRQTLYNYLRHRGVEF